MKMIVLGMALLSGLLTVMALAMMGRGQTAVAESAPEAKGGDDLRAKVQNPVS